jgi:hypothetical protein
MNASRSPQCSTFALDVYWTSARTGDAQLEHHVAGCAPCRTYLAMLDEVCADDANVATGVHARPRAPRQLRVLAHVTAAIAFAAGIGVFVESALPRTAPSTYVGVKGTPSVQLLVHRDRETSIWDGQSPVRAGDALAIRTACGDLANVAVAAEDPARGEWMRLSDAPCSPTGDVLPFTLVVDGDSENERIAVVMSDARLTDEALARAAHGTERSPHVWVVRFVIPEERP